MRRVYLLHVIVKHYPKSVGLMESNKETSQRAKAKTCVIKKRKIRKLPNCTSTSCKQGVEGKDKSMSKGEDKRKDVE